jgi:cyclic pyranopterin phosphate synthase
MTPSSAPVDRHGRRIEYLRISLTGRCNLRCVYCRPAQDQEPGADALTAEDVLNVAQAATSLGIRRVRLTGGEPLLRSDLEEIVTGIAALPGLSDLSVTTNGQGLAERAAGLAAAGLRRVNISLDSLVPETYAALTGGGDLASARKGMEAALRAGLEPVKVNVVLAGRRALEPGELQAFADLVQERPVHVRFIEVMPGCGDAGYLPAQEALERLGEGHYLEPVAGPEGGGPASYYRLDRSSGTIGVIAPISDPFCGRCNRLRVNARGELMPCLFSHEKLALMPALRGADPVSSAAALIRCALAKKPARYGDVADALGLRAMHVIGG